MLYNDALLIANKLVEKLAPVCLRCEPAGGVRRGKPDPHDIELVVIPSPGVPRPAFGQKVVHKTFLDQTLYQMEQGGLMRFISGKDKLKKFDVDPEAFGVRMAGYVRFELYVVTPPAQWGPIFTIRTGPSEFSHWLVTPRSLGGCMPSGYIQKDGSVFPGYKAGEQVTITGDALPTPEEEDFLRFLGLENIPPAQRAPRWPRKGGAA